MIQHPPIGGLLSGWIPGTLAGFLLVFLATLPANADFIFILKNGRQITAQNYREEGDRFRLSVGGGNFSIKKDQVDSVIRAGIIGVRDTPIPAEESLPLKIVKDGEPGDKGSPAPDTNELAAKGQGSEPTQEQTPGPEEIKAEQRAKEEREYQNKVTYITDRIKSLMDQYALATRGTSGPNPTLLDTPAAINARTADLQSRLKDARHNPRGPSDRGGVTLETGDAYTGRPDAAIRLRPGKPIHRVNPPLQPYSKKEKELSDLRKQINKLQNDRALLIQEMKQKNFNTSSLFLP